MDTKPQDEKLTAGEARAMFNQIQWIMKALYPDGVEKPGTLDRLWAALEDSHRTADVRAKATADLLEHIESLVDGMAAFFVAAGNRSGEPAPAGYAPAQAAGHGEEVVPVDEIEVSMQKGKRGYRVYGGRYRKYGIIAYFQDRHLIPLAEQVLGMIAYTAAQEAVRAKAGPYETIEALPPDVYALRRPLAVRVSLQEKQDGSGLMLDKVTGVAG